MSWASGSCWVDVASKHVRRTGLAERSRTHHLLGGYKARSDHGVEVRSADGPECEDQQRQNHLQVHRLVNSTHTSHTLCIPTHSSENFATLKAHRCSTISVVLQVHLCRPNLGRAQTVHDAQS